MQQQLEIAACLVITGREDESGQKSNPVRYKASRVAAANNFREYVKTTNGQSKFLKMMRNSLINLQKM